MAPFGIASPKAIRENVEEFWQNPVGTGPFRFESWDQGQEVRLARNEEWWGPTSRPRRGRRSERGSGRLPLHPGQHRARGGAHRQPALRADGLTPDDVPSVEQAGLQVLTRPPLNVSYMAMNMEKAPFDDPQVRQAVVSAINMQEIVQAFFGTRPRSPRT
ncbi:hypothetical protein GBA65_17780 [Rubrobacter marinus]|uniref:Solute-binding protein family 5 domain-containing protein n=1 Tax=Rubrobacter marinus TaxID=2653852 RepID=A0A6G8Q0S5_9ACTN|nr:ABC transporter substrate-binding protein [Rubrobacter marinus]QIN80063.1 hypothetical protein GBA65_17780 [Rubrobacter marinus]